MRCIQNRITHIGKIAIALIIRHNEDNIRAIIREPEKPVSQ